MRSSRTSGTNGRCSRISSSNTGRTVHPKSGDLGDKHGTETELLEALRDAIKVHRSLFLDGKILHRDVSENDIIITNSEDGAGFKGMLINLDLAKEEGVGPSGARHRTGTMEFMAIEVLLRISHTYRHDLEAFFYVLIWLCARRGWEVVPARMSKSRRSTLSHWHTGSYHDIARDKLGDMDKGRQKGLELILDGLTPSFACVKPLCRSLRDILFPYHDGLFTGTPQDAKVLYDPMITAFDNALAMMDQDRAQDGSREWITAIACICADETAAVPPDSRILKYYCAKSLPSLSRISKGANYSHDELACSVPLPPIGNQGIVGYLQST